jgi:hypothetical protein
MSGTDKKTITNKTTSDSEILSGAQIVIQSLLKEKVSHIFGIPGGVSKAARMLLDF